MLCASNRSRRRLLRDRAGVAALEFALFFTAFWFIVIATFDLGRYFITMASLRTLTAEMARQTLVYCAAQPLTTTCTLPATGTQSVATAETLVPWLSTSSFSGTPSASRSAANTSGVATITATAAYPFSFVLPAWSGLNTGIPITQTETMQM